MRVEVVERLGRGRTIGQVTWAMAEAKVRTAFPHAKSVRRVRRTGPGITTIARYAHQDVPLVFVFEIKEVQG